MKLLWIITCVLSVSFGVTDVAKAQQADKPAAALKRKSCSKWVFDECKVNGGVCGSGKKIGRRTGSNCGKKEKTFSCTIPCESNDMVNNKMNKDKKKRAGGKECKYMKGTWSACDPNTSTKNMTMMLKKGDPKKCPETRIKSKGCKQGKACKYTRGPWSQCDAQTNEKTRVLKLRRGDPNRCQKEKTLTKTCKLKCKYEKGEWSACDPVTNKKVRVLTLRRGDPNSCEKEKTISKSCRRNCKYNKGAWSKCDPTTKTKSRTLTLKAPSDSSCPASKPQTKDCKGNVNNKERCFFGAWGEFGPCRNGVKIKKRVVQYGDSECMKRAVKTLSC
ncbi:58-like isoform X2 [Octopus vulgaris]|uniref:58-like isoform X2 n=1 Tax=Octopus vulgaris TaxID=6645 RepID=A0AA36F218_OCTVU|nr:58-like isoform X2 [Octopus vulgaris]